MGDILVNRNSGGKNPNLGKSMKHYLYNIKSNLSNVFYMFKKDITFVYREKVVLGLLILMPITLAIVMATCGPLQVEDVSTAIYCADDSDAAQTIAGSFREADEFEVKTIWSEQNAIDMVRDGDAVLAIIIPEDFEENIQKGEKAEIKIIVDGSKPDLCAPMLAATSNVLRKSSTQLGTIILQERLEAATKLGKDMREMECTFVGARDMLSEMQETTGKMMQPLGELSSSVLTLSSSLEEMKKVPCAIALQEMSTELENTQREIESLDSIISDFEDTLDTIEGTPLEPLLPWDVSEASESIDKTKADINTLRQRLSFFQETIEEIDATIDSALVGVEEMQASLGAIGSGAGYSEETIESADEQMEDALMIIGMMDDDIKKISGSAVGISSAIEPFTIKESNIYGRDLEPRDFYATAFIPFIMLFITALLGALLISTEKEKGTFESLITSPIPTRDIILGKASTGIAIGAVQFGIILGIDLGFGIVCRGSIPLIFFIGMLMALVSIGMGLLLGAVVPNSMGAVMGALLIAIITLMVGGLFFSVELSSWMGKLAAQITPLTPAIGAFRGVMIKGYGFSDVATHIVVLIGFAVVILLASEFAFRKTSVRG